VVADGWGCVTHGARVVRELLGERGKRGKNRGGAFKQREKKSKANFFSHQGSYLSASLLFSLLLEILSS